MSTKFALCAVLALGAGTAQALQMTLPGPGGDEIQGILNTSVTVGAGLRTQKPASELIGKSNLNPAVCTGPNGAYQSCQGLFKDQVFPAQRLVSAPGAASINGDDGNLNYKKGDLFSGLTKVTSDLTLNWGEVGFFGRALYFHDFVNEDLKEYHPNRITSDNYLQVGRETPAAPIVPVDPLVLLNDPAALLTGLISSRPWGQPGPNGGRIVYGPGAVVRSKRTDPVVRQQIGSDLQLLDAVMFGKLPLWNDQDLTVKVGRQLVSWGESTTLALNSLNQANPVNANNFYRVGRTNEEVFMPVNMAFLSFNPLPDTTLETFYQLEWRGIEAPAPGSYFSDLDVGTNNAINTVSTSAGGAAEDPDRVATPLDSPLTGLSNTTSTIRRVRDAKPGAGGQFGVALKSYFENFGGGVEVGLYYVNYHSRLPIASFYATQASCARREGNDQGIDANDLLSFLAACPDIPFVHALTNPQQPEAQYATDSAAPLDSARFQLEYPENVHLIGLSFNTTVGDYSIQGEVAYRPNQPFQIDTQDLAFAAFGPTLTRCHQASLGCLGSAQLGNLGFGLGPDGNSTNYGSSDFLDASGTNPYPDLINVGIGHVPGSARAFPSFVTAYRDMDVGENPPCSAGMSDSDYHPGIDCYIRGYERIASYNFNFGTTRVFGATDNPIGADQIILVTEWGATWVPDLPGLDLLQFEAPGTDYHASAGADGSGADGSRQACSLNPACNFGADGIRFNPHQQDLSAFPDRFSWGYRVISLFSYESVLPGVSLRPSLTWSQDVNGTSPGPAGNFVRGRKQADLLIEARYKDKTSVGVGYSWFTGGGATNLLRDRDYLQFFARYQF
ncbi:DUF1302 family protein [Stagnimonas aquatica]|uniref:DUF1302 family protein n=1 Tax=Stagnimonas aquatica TaxID=2689987 RepID=A0A3N0V243_9GAMM|nr:DUF1302 family protein [Stagnimonas aquatica]ROH86783.1 DUF1302 family protein [Stagnimonas aquatica]